MGWERVNTGNSTLTVKPFLMLFLVVVVVPSRLANAEVWKEFFDSMLNIPNCHSLPSLGVLRKRLKDLFCKSYAKEIKFLRNRLVVLLIEHKRSRK